MLGLKNALLVDRTVYSFKGKFKNPNNDVYTTVYYFISKPETLVVDYKNGIETFTPELEITIKGEHPILVNDYFTLDNGTKRKVYGVSLNYKEHNIAVRDLLKPVVDSMVLVLR